MVFWVFWVLYSILDQAFKCVFLADEFNQLWSGATLTDTHKNVFLSEEIFKGASLFLIEQLVELSALHTIDLSTSNEK